MKAIPVINKDRLFSDGLDKLTESLRRDFLIGKVIIKKKDIQKLAKFETSKKIASVEEIIRIVG